MCGIAGIIARGSALNGAEVLEPMLRAIRHRGPDSSGKVIRHSGPWSVALGNTRLAIIDLSQAGSQPMQGHRVPCWMTYNGEVYNFRLLQEELMSQGHEFRSRTDTEVVLRAYEAWGLGAFERLRGMFGLGIWDETSNSLVLSRDPFGIKPLYYYLDEAKTIFLFASELRALLASGLVPRRINPEGLASFLQYGSVQSPATLVEGVRSISPGHYLLVDMAEERIRAREISYRENLAPVAPAPNREDAVKTLREVLAESVRLHLQSDVPLGVFLSGGIDSSALLALTTQMTKGEVHSYTVVFQEQEFSEQPFARLVAQRFGSRHHEIRFEEQDLPKTIQEALRAMDQPTMDGINTYVISKAVKEAGITVVLSGLGGDELFAGYPSFARAVWMRDFRRIPHGVRKAISRLGQTLLPETVPLRKLWDLMASDGSPFAAYAISRELFSPAEVHRLMGRTPKMPPQPFHAEPDDAINAVSNYEIQGYMANTLLRDSDFMSMAVSLELRVPFLDPEVIRCTLGQPGDWKLNRHRPKPLLLDAMGDLLPEEVWKRRKMGFSLPFDGLMRSVVRSSLEETFEDKAAFQRLGVNPELACHLWRKFDKGGPRKERWSRPWALFVLRKWCEENGVF